jgi:hypothetical protein
VESGEKVGRHGTAVGIEGLVFEGTNLHDSGVVDENVDAAEVSEGVLDQAGGLLGVGEIGGDEKHVFGRGNGVALDQGVSRFNELVEVSRGEDQPVSGAGESLREGKPKAARTTGDQDDTVVGLTLPEGRGLRGGACYVKLSFLGVDDIGCSGCDDSGEHLKYK